jgi:thymidylate synthase ThyX
MKVTQVAIRPSPASDAMGRPALTPELLAATGARYSRNNEGLESIISKINPANPDASVDSIFRMVDYGHQSILDMVPVAMFIDDISIWLAYYIWSLCPTAGGQESSTRYIKISPDSVISPEILGIPPEQISKWDNFINQAFENYDAALNFWEAIAKKNPEVTKIPASLLAENSESSQKKVGRMLRNYAFDRARYFLPIAASTNMMLSMSARGWVQLCQYLLSSPLKEPKLLGEKIKQELSLSTSRMLKHAVEKTSIVQGLQQEFKDLVKKAALLRFPSLSNLSSDVGSDPSGSIASPCQAFLEVITTSDIQEANILESLQFHDNRYSWVGNSLQRISVRFGWSAIAFAEIRDLNRHRTGTKYCPLLPQGFYSALDQIPENLEEYSSHQQLLDNLSGIGAQSLSITHNLLSNHDYTYIYWLLLGTQFPFEHLTTGDKFIYEAELRTGTGAHYRYAKHLHDVLDLWFQKYPASKSFVLEGSSEPE